MHSVRGIELAVLLAAVPLPSRALRSGGGCAGMPVGMLAWRQSKQSSRAAAIVPRKEKNVPELWICAVEGQPGGSSSIPEKRSNQGHRVFYSATLEVHFEVI